MTMPARRVRSIDWRIGRGPQGNVGFQVGMSSVPLYPQPAGTWIIGDDEHGSWEVSEAPDSGAWQLIAYNTGNYSHIVHVTFHVEVIEPRKVRPAYISLDRLVPRPDLSKAGPPVNAGQI